MSKTGGRKSELVVSLSAGERQELESWQRSTSGPQGSVRRGRIILLLAEGTPVAEVARAVGIGRAAVYKWAKRFLDQGIAGLRDRSGREGGTDG